MTKADRQSQKIADDAVRRQVKKRGSKALHTSRCTVCKSPDCKIIEARYINGETVPEIVVDYLGISESGMYRHFSRFNTKAKRNPDKFLDDLIESARESGMCLDERSLVPAIKLWLQKEGKLTEKLEVTGLIGLTDDELFERLKSRLQQSGNATTG